MMLSTYASTKKLTNIIHNSVEVIILPKDQKFECIFWANYTPPTPSLGGYWTNNVKVRPPK